MSRLAYHSAMGRITSITGRIIESTEWFARWSRDISGKQK